MKYIAIFLMIFFCIHIYGQELDSYLSSQNRVSQFFGLDQESQKIADMPTNEVLISSVDEEEYIVDAGDIFILKIDVKGPAIKVFNSIVTPAGYFIIPDAPTVYVRYLTLKDAREKITATLRQNFPQAQVEAHLFNLHAIGVDVLGALPQPGKIILNSGNRLFDAVTYKLTPALADSTIRFNWNTMSLRNVEIRRSEMQHSYDLLDYRQTGNLQNNPYLMDGDIIYIHYKDSLKYSVSVRGAVGQPIDFEYKQGDRIQDAISFASGFLPTADSNRIELVKHTRTELVKRIIDFRIDADIPLKPGDRVFVREKEEWIKTSAIRVEGELRFPGEYAIISGSTKLSEIIPQSGGFTPDASLATSMILRNKDGQSDQVEIRRLKEIRPLEMSELELSYFRQISRENKYLVNCDFERLFLNEDPEADVVLYDGDVILVPQKKKRVAVTGGVLLPGHVTFHEDWTYEDYIDAAGGYTGRARTGWTKIIDGRSGKWLDADHDIPIKDGDTIFVPEREDIDWYDVFKEGLTIVSQVATVILIIVSLNK